MDKSIKRCCTVLCSLLAFFLLSNMAVAGPENQPLYTGLTIAMSDTSSESKSSYGENPCAAKNPCAANPCAAKNPCAANPCAANPCAANPCAANPCGATNPCAAAGGVDPALITRPAGVSSWQGNIAELAMLGEKLWNDTTLSTNGLSCNACHQGNALFQPSFKQPYPHPVKMAIDRAGMKTIDRDEMVQICLVVPMATKTMPWDSKELAALTAYTEVVQKSFRMAGVNPCAAKNPCAANPCAANPCAAKNPCAANPCAANPCAAKNPCAN